MATPTPPSPEPLPETLGPHDPAPPRPASSGSTMPTVLSGSIAGKRGRSIAIENLLEDRLLNGASRLNLNGRSTPALAGIPLLRKLGQGGMGAVYLGLHPRLEREVAVKVLPLHLMESNPQLVTRFLREARIAAKIQSPHLVNVYDVHEEGGLFFIVMEFVDGQSAGQYLREVRKRTSAGLPEADALAICAGATAGLAAAHAEGVIHRDVKPENILLPVDAAGALRLGDAKLADLGLARSEDSDQGLTGTQMVMGTLGYLAPEQAMDAKSVGPAADVFSLGATLYALLTGTPPFERQSAAKALMDTLQQPHVPLAELRPDVSPAVVTLVDRCLAKDPAARFPDASGLLEYLQRVRAGDPVPLSSPGLPRAQAEAPVSPWRKRGIAAAAVLLGLLVLGMLANRGKRNPGGAPPLVVRDPFAAALADGRKGLEDQKWSTAEAAFKRAAELKSDSPEAGDGLAAARAGLAADDLFKQARAALAAQRYQEAEGCLEALEELRREGKLVLDRLPALRSTLDSLRNETGLKAWAASTAGMATIDGVYSLDDVREGRARWAMGLQRRAGQPESETRALAAKLPELFRTELPPGAHAIAEIPNFARTDRALQLLGGPAARQVFPGAPQGTGVHALDWSKPVVGVVQVPGMWKVEDRTAWKFGLRFEAAPGREEQLRGFLNLLYFFAQFQPNAVKPDTEGARWTVTNHEDWRKLLPALPRDDAPARLRRAQADVSFYARIQELMRDNFAVVRAMQNDMPAHEREAWAFFDRLASELAGLALKAQVQADAVWLRGRLFAQTGSALETSLRADSGIRRLDRLKALPAGAAVVVTAGPHEHTFLAALDTFLAHWPLHDLPEGSVPRADRARKGLVELARRGLAACDSQAVGALVPSPRAKYDHILVAADVPAPPPNLERLADDLSGFLNHLFIFGALIDKQDPAGVPEAVVFEKLPGVQHGSIPIAGRQVREQLEFRVACAGGRVLIAMAPKGDALVALQEALDRVQGTKSESLAEESWFKAQWSHLPQAAALQVILRPKPGQSDEALGFYLRSLDGCWDAGLRAPGVILKLLQAGRANDGKP
ncbi:MAG: serine/threonine protein kinase [Planctomycetes bacterium]|nr:serine/threonine protein kinase [Planctomycetota bacterium]